METPMATSTDQISPPSLLQDGSALLSPTASIKYFAFRPAAANGGRKSPAPLWLSAHQGQHVPTESVPLWVLRCWLILLQTLTQTAGSAGPHCTPNYQNKKRETVWTDAHCKRNKPLHCSASRYRWHRRESDTIWRMSHTKLDLLLWMKAGEV